VRSAADARVDVSLNVAIGSLVTALLATLLAATYDSPWVRESNYYCIGSEEGAFKILFADMLVHGYSAIDGEVTQVARDDFGLVDAPAVDIIEKEARPVLQDRPKGERYDVLLGDAFGDIAIPYHLVMREFDDLAASRLKPDGVYLVNVLDGVSTTSCAPTSTR
jgi:hypothetical protein